MDYEIITQEDGTPALKKPGFTIASKVELEEQRTRLVTTIADLTAKLEEVNSDISLFNV